MPHPILFFADRLPPLPGGMEVHAGAFMNHFTKHTHFPLLGTMTKDARGEDCFINGPQAAPLHIEGLSRLSPPSFVFFNSGRWIEELKQIRNLFPTALFLYRTGGNEIIKAPLTYNKIPDHHLRQAYWTSTLNETIDLMITNSAYTEKRLRDVGLACPFVRVVGGVNTAALMPEKSPISKPLTIFCAARFVPYKNHTLLISLIHQLASRGHHFVVRLAGDGPLLSQIQEQVQRLKLGSIIKFLGVLDNKQTCEEISTANIYMQLSGDQVTEVEGGSYIHSEGMGRSILEALTAGTFVIAGKSGALPEVVTKERGLLIDLDNLDQITNTVEGIFKNLPPRQPFIHDYCWTKVFEHYEKIFEGWS